jgi:RNA polymerase sigma-70 factor, ECF subfamily
MTHVAGRALDGKDPPSFAGFDQFYASCFPLVVSRVFLAVGHWYVAEDLAQDAMVEMMEQWDERSGRSVADNVAWAVGIAMNLARRHRRRIATGARAIARMAGWQRPTITHLEMEVLNRAETYRRIAALPKQQRVVAVMWVLADRSVDEIAQALGIAPSTVRTHFQRIRRQLADLSDIGFGADDENARTSGGRQR